MTTVRLMDTPADFQKLGISPDRIEPWEDQRRDDSRKGVWEWWYFDTILEDGTKAVVQFFPKSGGDAERSKDHPQAWIKVTTPDGRQYDEKAQVRTDEATFGEGTCDVRFGPHSFVGDLQEYDIHIDPINGVGCDLHLSSRAKPFRPGTGYWGFGDHDEEYFTWLCVVPTGEVNGVLTLDGQPSTVRGTGYHDHQWGNASFQLMWNNWTWARQAFDDYSILLFDFVASATYGYRRFPICFIQDAAGDTVFQNTHTVQLEVLEETRDESNGKILPAVSQYTFDNDGTRVVYTLRQNTVIESRDAFRIAPQMMRAKFGDVLGRIIGPMIIGVMKRRFAKQGIRPSYTRFGATGALEFSRDGELITRSGDLIYEFMYPGLEYRK